MSNNDDDLARSAFWTNVVAYVVFLIVIGGNVALIKMAGG